MDPLARLTGSGPSELSRFGSAALAGLAAALDAAHEQADPADPARPACRAAAEYVRSLLGVCHGDAGFPAAPAAPVSPAATATPASGWAALRENWAHAPEWKQLLGAPDPAEDADLPRHLWMLTHRLPAAAAEAWRAAWLKATDGLAPDATTALRAAGPHDLLLVPPLPDGAPGLRLNPGGPPDARLAGDAGPISSRLLPVVSAALRFVEHDGSLRHMLRSIFRFGIAALQGASRGRYEKSLVDRFERLRAAEAARDAAGVVFGWADLDEALHSLVHQPLAHPTSSFAQTARASRDALAAVRDFATGAGLTVHIQALAGRYADCRAFTDPDADAETAGGTSPGEVAHCARVFVRLGGTPHPGRVLYCPR